MNQGLIDYRELSVLFVGKSKSRSSSSSSTSSRLSTLKIEDIIERLKTQQYRPSTSKTYYQAWKAFNQFFVRLDVKPKSWEYHLTLFVAHLVNEKKQSSTVKSYISAIKAILRQQDIEIQEDRLLLNSITRACRLNNDTLRTRLPIKKTLLTVIVKNIHKLFDSPQPYLTVMYRALFTTAYYGMFRVGELTASDHVLKAKDVYVGENKDKFRFVLFTSKTHNKRDNLQIIKINSIPSEINENLSETQLYTASLCPFKLMMLYSDIRSTYRTAEEQFFIFSDGSPVQPRHFSTLLKKAIQALHLNPKLYGTHSFRAGRSVDLFEMGVSVETIMKLGRWTSTAVYNYLR